MTHADAKRAVVAAGEALGFARPRVTQPIALDRAELYATWLAEGRAGDMRFLLHHRKARLDPRTRFPWARSIVSALFPYAAPAPPRIDWRRELRGRIASYALGPDYHDLVGARLRSWAGEVEGLLPGCRTASYVDTGAIFEHEWAARAGVGWTGKHTLTIAEDLGSYAFLAELLIGVELDPDAAAPDRCGTCERCIHGCPTAAIEPGYRLEPRRCISYLTIEHRGAIDPALRPAIGEWLFGCDLCQLACPWNRPAEPTIAQDALLAPRLAEILALDESGFAARYGTTALRRAGRVGRVGLARNAAVVLGNTANPEAVGPLAGALHGHEAALVRSHAAWSLGRLAGVAGHGATRALESARKDPDEEVRAEVRAALDGTPSVG